MKMQIDDLIEGIRRKDIRALARAISIIEDHDEGMEELLEFAYGNMHDQSLIIGVTGPGGAGKSTMIDKLIKHYRTMGKKVAVIAVDPSSPYTGGAFLGDRIRMGTHNNDKGVFIRSFGSRGCMGGISEGTKSVLYLYKNYDFDVIIVESLGIGQDETEITNFVDVTVVAVVPGYGDAVQIAKAGMQEIADIFVVNKADKPEAEEFYNQMKESIVALPEEIRPEMYKTVASENIGITELAEGIMAKARETESRREERNVARIKIEIESSVTALVKKNIEQMVEDEIGSVLSGAMTPFEVSNEIFASIRFS